MNLITKTSTYLLFFFIPLAAQSSDPLFTHFSIEEGLSQSTVHSILQDNQGYMWIATEDGLNRFDGYNFTIYRNDPTDSSSLAGNRVHTVMQDNQNRIWVGTTDGLSVLTLIADSALNTEKEGFINYYNSVRDTQSLSSNDVRCLYRDNGGNIWIGTSKGLSFIRNELIEGRESPRSLTFDRMNSNPELYNLAGTELISSIIEDGNGSLWIGTMGNGIIELNKQSGKVLNFKHDPSDPGSPGSNYIIRLYLDRAGRLWAGTYRGGLNLYDNISNNFIRYLPDEDNPGSITDNRIYSMFDDDNGNLWIGTFECGINKLDTRKNKFISYKSNSRKPKSLSSNFVRCLFIDRSGNLWAGTNKGVNKMDLKQPKFYAFRNDYEETPLLSDSYVLSITEDRNGGLWIGTNKGLDNYNPEEGNFSSYAVKHNNPKSNEGFVYSIKSDAEGYLWLGTFGGGLLQCDLKGKIIRQYIHTGKRSNEILDNRIHSLYIGAGEIIIGTVAGICVLDRKTERFRNYLVSMKDSALLSGRSINVIYKDRNNIFWIGTSGGLVSVDVSGRDSYSYVHGNASGSSISSNDINSILEDLKGNLWIGTDKGLNLLDRKSNSFALYTTKDGLPNDYIAGILEDDRGCLWISTNNGVSKFDPKQPEGKRFRNYDLDDGLQGLEFTEGAAFKNSKGEIYFGGTNGFNKFNPALIQDNPNIPAVAIISFSIAGKNKLNHLQIAGARSISLDYNENFFSFEFAAFDYTNPKKNKYAYRLEGFDKDWIDSGSRRFANYTNIDPGKYVFRVKASNNDGVWNEQGASVGIIIKPPFYKTWTAYIFYLLAIVSGLYSLRRFELQKKKRKNEAVMRIEKEKAKLMEAQLRAEKAELQTKAIAAERLLEEQNIRARIASDIHDEIGSNLSSITLLGTLMNNNIDRPDELKKQLTDINKAAKISTESIRDIIWFINPGSDKLSSLVNRMKETASLMLKGIDYRIETTGIFTDEKVSPELKRNLSLIFKESMNNIAKHSSAKNILIRIAKQGEEILMEINDDGSGFDESLIKAGNGLKNIRNRAEQLNGKAEITSVPGKGTIVSVRINIT